MNRSWLVFAGSAATCALAAGCSPDNLDFTRAPVRTQSLSTSLNSLQVARVERARERPLKSTVWP